MGYILQTLFKDSSGAIYCLGRNTHRVASSNNGTLNDWNSQITLKWQDYSEGNKEKALTLTAMEFIYRFLLQVLLKGFMKKPALWVAGKPKQNEGTDWARRHLNDVRYSASTVCQSLTTVCVLTEYFQFHLSDGERGLNMYFCSRHCKNHKSEKSHPPVTG